MESWTRWQDWSNVALGVLAMCVPLFTTDSSNGSTLWSAEVFGALIICVGLWALARPTSKGAEWTQVIVGALFVAAPFMFDYRDYAGAATNAYVVGGLAAVLAAWALYEMPQPTITSDNGRRHYERL